MRAVSALKSSGEPYTWEDLEDMPDDGRRYEIVDGTLLVTPAPVPRHQRGVTRLWSLLDRACPDHLEVFVAPLDVKLADDTVLEPDVLVTEVVRDDRPRLEGPPKLAVEILSLRTRLIDLNVKKAKFEAAGCPSYWIVDPDEPSITIWELRNGAYELVGHAVGDEACTIQLPFPVKVVPAELVAPKR